MVVGIVGFGVKNSLILVFVNRIDFDYWFCQSCLPFSCCGRGIGLMVQFMTYCCRPATVAVRLSISGMLKVVSSSTLDVSFLSSCLILFRRTLMVY